MWGGLPESWRLIVKCLEIPQEVRQEEEGRWSHASFQAGLTYHVAPLAGLAQHRAVLVSPRQPCSPDAGAFTRQRGGPFRLCHSRD